MDELRCLSDDRTCVIVVQHWRDRLESDGDPLSWLVVTRNGRRVSVTRCAGLAMQDDLAETWADMRATYARRGLLDEATARRLLAELAGVEAVTCGGSDCAEVLPIGATRCVECRRSAAQAGAGGAGVTSGAQRRADREVRL